MERAGGGRPLAPADRHGFFDKVSPPASISLPIVPANGGGVSTSAGERRSRYEAQNRSCCGPQPPAPTSLFGLGFGLDSELGPGGGCGHGEGPSRCK
jgi:hypothetical protein